MAANTWLAIAGLVLVSAAPADAQRPSAGSGVDNLGTGGASHLGSGGASQLGTSGVENLPCTGAVCGGQSSAERATAEGLASPPTTLPILPPPVPATKPSATAPPASPAPRPQILTPDDALFKRR